MVDVKKEVEQIVEEGQDVRQRVGKVIESAADSAAKESSGLTKLVTDTVESAVRAVDRATPKDPDSTLRQVVDGVGDGLERTAQATRLAVEEASGEGRAYASDDLKQLSNDLGSLVDMFVDTVEKSVRGAADETKTQYTNVRKHASNTLESIKPSLQSAAEAAAKDPVGLAGETAGAAVDITRETAGALFSTLGKLIQGAGDRIAPKREDESEQTKANE